VPYVVFITSPRAGVPFAAGAYTVEAKTTYNSKVQAQAFANAKVMSPAVVALFDAMPSVHPEFAAGEAVVIGDMRAFEAKTWRCIQAHTTQSDWTPPVVPALWLLLPLPGASAWAQPVSYSMPSRVTYSGRLYDLRQAHTSQAAWTPPEVPALWLDIGPAEGVGAYTRAVWWVVSSDDPDYTEVERAKEI
jgi:hypothetical protein